MNSLENKKNSHNFDESKIFCFCKNFTDLSKNEINAITKIKLENFENTNSNYSNQISFSDHRSFHFLILQNKKLIAYSRLVPPSFNLNKLKLEKFCVSKKYRGKGISKILIDLIFKKSQESFPNEILNLSSLEETKNFYEKFGFLSNYLTHDKNGTSHYIMSKKFE